MVEGLHQAVEAKEGVAIQQENQTLASITFQNLFRLYDRLSGMTGTADTESVEFQQIYGLGKGRVISTNQPMIVEDLSTWSTERRKKVRRHHRRYQSSSVQKSARFGRYRFY